MARSKYPLADKATQYARDVVAGEVIACRLVRLACERHLRDMERDDLIWDEEAANNICRFGQLMKHIKGEWAGKLIELQPWQCFMFGSIFGWKWKSTGIRKYTEAYAEIPRKNAKSTSAAIVGNYMLVADNEPGAEVYSGATSEKQAFEVFRPAWMMTQNNPAYKAHYGLDLSGTAKNPGTIFRLSDASRFEAVVHNPGDGSSPHCGIVDEYHEHKDSSLYDTFSTGMGARKQPLLLDITTAGTNTSVPCYALRKRASDVLNGVIEDEALFALIFTIDEGDDWKDFEVWKKANPNFGVSVYEHYLRQRYLRAMNNPAERNIILCKHLNLWSNAGVAAFDMAAWERCGDVEVALEKYQGCRAAVGIDLASKIDLCCMVFFIEPPEGKPVISAKHYIPEATAEKPENAAYRQWAEEGWLTITDGTRTDFGAVEDDLRSAASILNISRLGYDPREATYLMGRIHEWAGFDLVEITQGPAQMSEPMKELEALIAGEEIVHPSDPCLTWQMGNVVKKMAAGGGPVKYYYPTKEKGENKIDAAVAAIMAVKMAHVEDDSESVYNSRELLVI